MSCHKAVVKLVVEQAGKSEGFRTAAQFLVFPTILSTLEVRVSVVFIN